MEAAAPRFEIKLGDISLFKHLTAITKYLKSIPSKPIHNGSTSHVKSEKGKAHVTTEPAPSDAELKQVIVPSPELTSLIKPIIDYYSMPFTPVDQKVKVDASAAMPPLKVMVQMSIGTERMLWTLLWNSLLSYLISSYQPCLSHLIKQTIYPFPSHHCLVL